MGSERSARNIAAAIAVFVGLMLLPALFAGCGLPSEVQYECLTDATSDTVSLSDTVTATCTKQ